MTLPDPGAWGPYLAILAMALATYLCRISGVVLMGFVPLTPRVRRGLAALPGSIVFATVLPLIERLGLAAGLALVAAILSMVLRRSELLALLVGMATDPGQVTAGATHGCAGSGRAGRCGIQRAGLGNGTMTHARVACRCGCSCLRRCRAGKCR